MHRQNFLDAHDNQPRAQLLYTLNMGLMTQ
jgi:hypothetical protein